MKETTYILIGRTNSYQAKGNGRFRGRVMIADGYIYAARDEASRLLAEKLCSSSDDHVMEDDGRVTSAGETILEVGGLSYEYDGYAWSWVAIDDLSEEEAVIALRDLSLDAGEEKMNQILGRILPAKKEEDMARKQKDIRRYKSRIKHLKDVLKTIKGAIEADRDGRTYKHHSYGEVSLEELKYLLIDPIFGEDKSGPEDVEP